MLSVRVVKLGGNELDRPAWLAACAAALKVVEPVVVVHGGGRAVSALSQRLGLRVEKREGRRVTPPEVAEVVEMVLAGPANRSVVAALRRAGIDAIGLAGVDGGLLSARPVGADGDGGLGHVGEIAAVRVPLLLSLLADGLTPVIAPMAPGPDGGLPYNVNADDAAAALAGALQAMEVLFICDVPGVCVDGVVRPSIAADEIETLVGRGVATEGMAAKLRAGARALEAGARAARIGDLQLLAHPAAGTAILAPAVQPA